MASAPGLLVIQPGLATQEALRLAGKDGHTPVPELRRRGLETALLHERMRHAFEHGCDLAMMAAQPGSDAQRNAERKGLRIAYTRTK